MFVVRGKRNFVEGVQADRLAEVLRAELSKLGAEQVRQEGRRIFATNLRVTGSKTPTFLLQDLVIASYDGSVGGLSYEGNALVQYSVRYYALWLVPSLLAIGYSFATSPLVLLVLPVGALLARAFLPLVLRIWFEEFFYAVELKARALQSRAGA
jgi:hypothetical protein